MARDWHAVVPERVPPTWLRRGELARGRLPSQASVNGRRAFVQLRIWRDLDSIQAVRTPDMVISGPGLIACFVPNPVCPDSRRIGTVNITIDALRLEVLAHELTHAMIHRITVFGPHHADIIDQRLDGDPGAGERSTFYGGRADEEVAYEMGRWFEAAYTWAYGHLQRHARRKRR